MAALIRSRVIAVPRLVVSTAASRSEDRKGAWEGTCGCFLLGQRTEWVGGYMVRGSEEVERRRPQRSAQRRGLDCSHFDGDLVHQAQQDGFGSEVVDF